MGSICSIHIDPTPSHIVKQEQEAKNKDEDSVKESKRYPHFINWTNRLKLEIASYLDVPSYANFLMVCRKLRCLASYKALELLSKMHQDDPKTIKDIKTVRSIWSAREDTAFRIQPHSLDVHRVVSEFEFLILIFISILILILLF